MLDRQCRVIDGSYYDLYGTYGLYKLFHNCRQFDNVTGKEEDLLSREGQA